MRVLTGLQPSASPDLPSTFSVHSQESAVIPVASQNSKAEDRPEPTNHVVGIAGALPALCVLIPVSRPDVANVETPSLVLPLWKSRVQPR